MVCMFVYTFSYGEIVAQPVATTFVCDTQANKSLIPRVVQQKQTQTTRYTLWQGMVY